MKKLLVYTSAVGVAAGLIYCLCKAGELSGCIDETRDDKEKNISNKNNQDIFNESDIFDEIHKERTESDDNINERHAAASEIMKDAYLNIMEDFTKDDSYEETCNNLSIKKDIIDNEDALLKKEIDRISSDLDKLI